MHRDERIEMARERAAGYVRVAIECITREYPHFPYFIATGPESYRTHRELHPAFYGSFDWHSCVEMHWVIVRLLRRFPDLTGGERARATLDSLLTAENLSAEAAFFNTPANGGLERPYGWGWLLTLAYDLETWDDPDGRRWAAAVTPLAELLASKLVTWLPKLTYPVRTGVHPNTAFSLSRSLDYADRHAELGNPALRDAIHAAAGRWFAGDLDYPARYEPSGSDFLSPALTEAELMSRLLPTEDFATWLDGFLPGMADEEPATLFSPAVVSDASDGQIAHLHGLNLSRAWAFVSIAERLPADDLRIGPLLAAAERHTDASLEQVSGSDYMVEHWLAAYATLLLT